jgi:hypothetical protein
MELARKREGVETMKRMLKLNLDLWRSWQRLNVLYIMIQLESSYDRNPKLFFGNENTIFPRAPKFFLNPSDSFSARGGNQNCVHPYDKPNQLSFLARDISNYSHRGTNCFLARCKRRLYKLDIPFLH